MILDIPTRGDFDSAGITFLNLAWDAVLALEHKLDDASLDDWDVDGEVSDEYWTAAQTPLATALSMAQQGTEFLLKGRIASISPFLLISGSPTEWPRGCDQQDRSFADFRMIDAQDLIRVHNTVAPERLSESMRDRFNELRRYRNSVMHTVDPRRRFTSKEIIIAILEICDSLIAPRSWMSVRREYREANPDALAFSTDDMTYVLAREMNTVLALLEPVMAERHFGFKKRQRRYLCYQCTNDCRDQDFLVELAQLRPNSPKATTVHCVLCEADYAVVRQNCVQEGCKGNVLDKQDGICLTCYDDGT